MDALLFFIFLCVVFTVLGRLTDKNKGKEFDDRITRIGSADG